MRVRPTVRTSLICFLLCSAFAPHTLSAQHQTGTEKASLLDTATPTISQAAYQLIRTGEEVLRAADQMSQQQTCVMDRELVTLGRSLENASQALRTLQPALLRPGLGDLVEVLNRDSNSSKGSASAAVPRRVAGYRDAVDKIAQAGRTLSLLDPAGAAGPPARASQLLAEAGRTLMDVDEQSGIGLHLKHTGESMQTLRLAISRKDKFTCVYAARLMGNMVGLTGENLAGSASVLVQSRAALSLGSSLSTIAQPLSKLSYDALDLPLDQYQRSFLLQEASLSKRAAICRRVDPPIEPAGLRDQFRAAASQLDSDASQVRGLAAHIGLARNELASASKNRESSHEQVVALRAAGEWLKLTNLKVLIIAGDVLIKAAELLEARKPRLAADVLREAGRKIVEQEYLLIRQ